MSSASTPPRQKNTKVVTMYMIPIRLWSVVVIQLVQPRASGATRRVVRIGTGATWVAMSRVGVARSLGAFYLSGARLGVQLRPRHLGKGVGFGDELLLVGQPGFELGGRDGLHGRDHAGVAAPA